MMVVWPRRSDGRCSPVLSCVVGLVCCATLPIHGQEIALSPVLSIGVFDGDPAYTFGRIVDIGVDDRARIYALDELAREIRVFDRNGQHLQTVGGTGEGPGEFEVPTALSIDGDTVLYVSDVAHRRITRYRIADSLKYLGDYRVDVEPMGICVLGDHLYVLGYHEGNVIHKFSIRPPSAEPVQSFAGPYQPHPARRHRLDHIACLDAKNMLVIGVEESPIVRSFTTAGDSVWSITLADHQPLSIIEESDGSVRYFLPERQDFYHWMNAIVALSDSVLAVQLGVVKRGIRARETTEWDTRILSIAGAERIRVPTAFRFLFVRGLRVYGTTVDPYPQVIVAEIDRQGQ